MSEATPIVWSSVEASCPMCQARLEVREVGGGFVSGQDSDLFLRMGSTHVIEAEIHTCPSCWFSGYASDFLDARWSDPQIDRYFEEFAPEDVVDEGEVVRRDDEFPTAHERYWLSARVAPLTGLSPREIGLRFLRAYWCLRLEPARRLPERDRSALSKSYLKQAIAFLRKSLRHEKSPVFVYLVAELCRRNANFVRSEHYFDRFLAAPHAPEYLRRAAEKLRARTLAGDSRHLSLEEILYEERSRQPRATRRKRPGDSAA